MAISVSVRSTFPALVKNVFVKAFYCLQFKKVICDKFLLFIDLHTMFCTLVSRHQELSDTPDSNLELSAESWDEVQSPSEES